MYVHALSFLAKKAFFPSMFFFTRDVAFTIPSRTCARRFVLASMDTTYVTCHDALVLSVSEQAIFRVYDFILGRTGRNSGYCRLV